MLQTMFSIEGSWTFTDAVALRFAAKSSAVCLKNKQFKTTAVN